MIKDKIVSRGKAAKLAASLRKKGKKIGFTSGSFDILHSGHASYLEQAKKKCDVLFVAVNSDASVKKYKGADRPIVPEKERIKLVAALTSVDYVFLFDERRNRENLVALRPHFYIKAGDYKPEELTSADVMKGWKGKILLIKPEEGMSSSAVIEKIVAVYGKEKKSERPIKSSPAVFLDRDGTINEEVHFLHEPSKFRLLPHVGEGLRMMQDMKFKLIIVTDQQGIGLGYFTKEDFFKVNSEMFRQLSKYRVIIDKVYFCPHSMAEKCKCRKPGTGMIERAKEELNIDLSRSFVIGDKSCEIQLGKNAGMKSILVQTGHAGKDKQYDAKPDYVASDLLDAAKWIKKVERN